MPLDHWHDVRGQTDMDIVGFGVRNSRLTVEFEHKGHQSIYVYGDKSHLTLCEVWIKAVSIGKFFHRYIKPLPYAKLS